MSVLRKKFKDFGIAALELDSSIFPSILIGLLVSVLPFLDIGARKEFMGASYFGLSTFWSLVLQSIIFAMGVILVSIFIRVGFKWLGEGIIWLSEHRIGMPIAKINLKVVEVLSERSQDRQEFMIRVNNSEKSDVDNAVVSFGIFGPLKDKNKNHMAGNLSGLWIRTKDGKDSGNQNGEYRTTIPSGKEREVYFVKIDRQLPKFSVKFTSGEHEFIPGRYILKILFYGDMIKRQVISELSGYLVLRQSGQIYFDLQKIKKKRGFVSLVKEPLWI